MKMKTQGIITALMVVALLLAGYGVYAQGGAAFHTRLFPTPLDAASKNTITGVGSATAQLSGTKLTVSGTFEGMKSPATGAQLHRCPIMGDRGPAIGDLTVSNSTSGTVSGSLDLTPDQVDDLKNGRIYIQIDSERAPKDGNLWGWLQLTKK
jgi:CHRD domain